WHCAGLARLVDRPAEAGRLLGAAQASNGLPAEAGRPLSASLSAAGDGAAPGRAGVDGLGFAAWAAESSSPLPAAIAEGEGLRDGVAAGLVSAGDGVAAVRDPSDDQSSPAPTGQGPGPAAAG